MQTQRTEQDGLAILANISWAQFEQFDDLLEADRSAKLSYLHGTLEIMSPHSELHEDTKKILAQLIELYCRRKKIRFYARGSVTLKKTGYTSGEPDESYCFGEYKKYPDLVIEVIVTSGSIDKLALYKPLNIKEVWFWQQGRLSVYCLHKDGYERVSNSCVLPALDLSLVETCSNMPDQYDALDYFESQLQAK